METAIACNAHISFHCNMRKMLQAVQGSPLPFLGNWYPPLKEQATVEL